MRDDWKTSPRLRRGVIALAGLALTGLVLAWLLFLAPGSMFPRLDSSGSMITAKLRSAEPGIDAQIWFRPSNLHDGPWLDPAAPMRGSGPRYRIQAVVGPGEDTRRYKLTAASIVARDGKKYPIQLAVAGDVAAAAQWHAATKLEGRALATIYDSTIGGRSEIDAPAEISGARLVLEFELEEAKGPRAAELDYDLRLRSNFERLLGHE